MYNLKNQYRKLGNTEIKVSPIGLGTVKFGRNTDVKYPNNFTLPSDRQIDLILHEAQELGINLLDTAPAYGTSEERLGKCKIISQNRSKWILCGKVGEEYVGQKSTYNYDKKHIKYTLTKSLKKLNTDYLDLLLIHSNGNDLEIINNYAVFNTLADLKQQGYIRAFGMSTKTVAGGILTVEHADLVMVTLNPLYTDELEVIDKAKEKNKGVLIKKALISGNFNKLKENKQNPISVCLNFALENKAVSSVIIGTINIDHLQKNCSYI